MEYLSENFSNFQFIDDTESINFRNTWVYSSKIIRRLSKKRPKYRRSISTPNSGHKISRFCENDIFDYRAPMNELIQSEKRYIEDLKQCIEVYLKSFRISGPASLKGKEGQIFGNLEQLYKFHAE
jgi:hypothetical protein